MLVRLDIKYKDAEFISYLLQLIEERIYDWFEMPKAVRLEEYMNSIERFKTHTNKYLSCQEIIYSIPRYLRVPITNRTVTIEINQNRLFSGTSIKFIDLIKFITYGNIEVEGYPLILEIFEDISENAETYYRIFEMGV